MTQDETFDQLEQDAGGMCARRRLTGSRRRHRTALTFRAGAVVPSPGRGAGATGQPPAGTVPVP